jgi:hypothetical protein
MASDSRVFVSTDACAPTFRIAGLDMTGVGWSLRVACQVAVDDRPDGYCRLAVGHGGAHQTKPVDRPRPESDARRVRTSTAGPDDPTGAACSPGHAGKPAASSAPSLVRPGPGRSRRVPGPVRPSDIHR